MRLGPCGHWAVAEEIAALAMSAVEGPVNVASGQGRSIGTWRARTRRSWGGQVLRLGALPDRPGEVPFMVADTGRLRLEMGHATRFDPEADLLRLTAGACIEGSSFQ
jgi:hypothetical protein